jgi:ABC-type dipeptide/oligopeptide/nickel transport system ATPase component
MSKIDFDKVLAEANTTANQIAQAADELAVPANPPVIDTPIVPVSGPAVMTQPEPVQPPTQPKKPVNLSVADEFRAQGKKLAAKMVELDIHPVIIVGSKGTGKTAMLTSLLALLKSPAGEAVNIQLDEPLIALSDPYGKEVYDSAKQYYHQGAIGVMAGQAMQATTERLPFFIPLVITPKNGSPVRFAFLESAGEWYEAKADSVDFYPGFKYEIEEVLRHYSGAISTIYVAPLTQKTIKTAETIDDDENKKLIHGADLALCGVLTAYQKIRINMSKDAHIFLLTKWDALLSIHSAARAAVTLEDALSKPDFKQAQQMAGQLYPSAFTMFQALPVPTDKQVLLPYSSGLIAGRDIIRNSVHQPLLDKHRKKLWNILYGNAIETHAKDAALFREPVVAPPSFWQVVYTWLRRIFG